LHDAAGCVILKEIIFLLRAKEFAMPTIDMQDTNRRAMTALNYASFLDDRHYLSHQGITAELVQRQRLAKSREAAG
jgi:hypothetical protein